MKKTIWFILTVFLFVGCGKSPDKHFKDYLEGKTKDVSSKLQIETDKDDFLTYCSLNSLKYNVIKTDSLISPYTAYVTYKQIHMGDENKKEETKYVADMSYEVKLDYAYQNRRWILQQVKMHDYDMEFRSGDYSLFRYVAPRMKKTVNIVEGSTLDSLKKIPINEKGIDFLWRDF